MPMLWWRVLRFKMKHNLFFDILHRIFCPAQKIIISIFENNDYHRLRLGVDYGIWLINLIRWRHIFLLGLEWNYDF